MAKGKNKNQEDNFELVEGALSKSEKFIEDNSKTLTTVLAVIIGVVAIYMAYTKFYVGPQQEAAATNIFFAEQKFEIDSFRLALDGDGNSYGFLEIINEYSATKTGNAAKYYAGLCYLQLGEYENAIDQLKSFSGKDVVISAMALGAMGDAYSELGQNSEAISAYMKAAAIENDFSTPMYLFKAGLLHENEGNYAKALEVYTKIDDNYDSSAEGRYIKKYIQRAKLNM